ncbi:hypothetical protein ACIGCZ_29355 [Streptomyces nigra]|uniref:hypothetical protein n=1 Tax=Streptomyces nigra TaxID=1827580 RepID=UPI0037CFEDB3
MRQRRHHGKETTYNDRVYVVRTTRSNGLRSSSEFSTSDKRQAYREARRAARAGQLIRFVHHAGRGSWLDLTAEVMKEVAAQ